MNNIEAFFDNIASKWDDMECHSDEEKIRLLKEIGIKEGELVIDVACGTGVITDLIHDFSKSDVFGIDISHNMIEKAKVKYKDKTYAHFYHRDLLTLDETNTYDIAVIYNAYPHFLDPKALSKKLYSILKENGKFAIIHSLSREELTLHHKGRADSVSRVLNPIEEEAKYFLDLFNVIKAKEDDHSITLICQKK